MVKEYRRPFYIFDEIDQSLDPANVLKLGSILRQELGRKYIVISHRLNRSHPVSYTHLDVYKRQFLAYPWEKPKKEDLFGRNHKV